MARGAFIAVELWRVVLLLLMWSSKAAVTFGFVGPHACRRILMAPSLQLARDLSESTNSFFDALDRESEEFISDYKRHGVQWYPGHIAKAERQLAETLKAVDVVLEIRDARACKATSHAKVGEWCAGRPRIVVMTHVDQIPAASMRSWKRSYEIFGAARWDGEVTAQTKNQAKQAQKERKKYAHSSTTSFKNQPNIVSPVEGVLFVDGKTGQGVHALHRTIFKAGSHVQERRNRRGLKERPLRVGVIGYPNVGKSALINRILGRKRARAANTPGVTRSLQWVRVSSDEFKTSSKKNEFELLDSPGIIPAKIEDQSDASLLAACNCIGAAAYESQLVAAFLCERLLKLHQAGKGKLTSPAWPEKCSERYRFNPLKDQMTGEDILYKVADNCCQGSPEDAARKILQDFRTGRLGKICLQLAPKAATDHGQQRLVAEDDRAAAFAKDQEEARLTRAHAAIETAKKKGLELPPIIGNSEQEEKDVGKGLFDGW